MEKVCFKCNQSKPLEDYYTHPDMQDGHINKCKECNNRDVRKNYKDKHAQYAAYDRNRQRYNPARILQHRYNSLVARAKRKSRHYLGREEWTKWVNENLDDFNKLYHDWMDGGFSRNLAPSIDRINNDEGYYPDNMQWLAQGENSRKFIN